MRGKERRAGDHSIRDEDVARLARETVLCIAPKKQGDDPQWDAAVRVACEHVRCDPLRSALENGMISAKVIVPTATGASAGWIARQTIRQRRYGFCTRSYGQSDDGALHRAVARRGER